MNPLLQQLLDFLKTTSPLVWSVLIRQVYVNIVSNFLWAIGAGIACVFLEKLGKKSWAKYEEEGDYSDWNVVSVLSYIGSVSGGVITLALVIDSIMKLINPQYYAIQLILIQLH